MYTYIYDTFFVINWMMNYNQTIGRIKTKWLPKNVLEFFFNFLLNKAIIFADIHVKVNS